MLRHLSYFFVILGFAIPAHAESITCRANVDCKGLFTDLLTDKFVLRYPSDKWAIFVYAETYTFGDNKATSHAVVGVTPISKEKYAYFPAQTSSHLITTPRISSVYQKQDLENKVIRRAIEILMKNCETSKNCDLD